MANRRKPYDRNDRAIRLSRSALEESLRCQRCFYLDRRLGYPRPSGPAFTLNNAVDALLKAEMDAYRAIGRPHPLMERMAPELDLIPMAEPRLDDWRATRRGVTSPHDASGFVVAGAIDDLVLSRATGKAHVVDFKATGSKSGSSLEGKYREGYPRQLEVYTWLLRRNGLDVSDTGFFLFALVDQTVGGFDGMLRFDQELVTHVGDTSWIEPALIAARACLDGDDLPEAAADCDWCKYTNNVANN